MIAMNKASWRKYLRSLHQGQAVRDEQSRMLCRHIISSAEYENALVIGGYMPLAWEADVIPILWDALNRGKTLVLPLCGDAPFMTLRCVRTLEELVPGAYGILQPRDTAEIVAIKAVDLLLVPLEGIDGNGFRLGKGGGYYDCLLAEADVYTVGCALSWQRVERLPREPWDKPMYACADEDGLHCFRK